MGARVALVWFDGDHNCPGGVLVAHGVKEGEDDLVSMGVVWLMVQWDALLVLGGCGSSCSFCGVWIGLC